MADSVLRVILKGDAAQLNSSLRTASKRLDAFGSKMQSVASSLRTVSIPLAIAGGAAVKMAASFDKSMTQIKSLVGVAGDEVDAMGEKVKAMATDTGTNANEAAEALFFITSAGLRGSEAMDVLKASMKAAAVGLGDTKTVADLATSAMNAYGSATLSATDATDVMVSAVREGKLEASELAGSMGRVLPVASAMGVRFDEVGAAFAALSRTGTNAAEAATQIRGILTSLLKPTKEASDTLAEMGLSAQGLREQIREKGLLSVLETLKTNFEGNDDAAQKVFGNVRALSGIMDLLGANVDTTRSIFDSMTESVGATNTAFETLQQSAEFKLRKSITEVKNSFQETGDVILLHLLPQLNSLSESLTKTFEAFKTADTNTQNFIITAGEIIVVGPLIASAIGMISKALATLNKRFFIITGTIAAFTFAFNGMADALDKSEDVRTRLLGIAKALVFPAGAAAQFGKYVIDAMLAPRKEMEKTELQAQRTSLMLEKVFGKPSKPAFPEIRVPLPKGYKADDTSATTTAPAKKTPKQLEDEFYDLEHAAYKANEAAFGVAVDTGFLLAESSASVEYFGNVVKSTANNIIEPIESIGEKIEEATEGVSNFALIIGRDLAGAFGAVLEGDNFFKTMIGTLKDLAKQLLATAAAAAILALLTGKGFGTVFNSLSGINLFGSRNADVGGPIGTPSGTGLGTVPANLVPNNSMNLTGQFRIDGQDLVVAVERANKQRANFITG